MVDLGFRYPMFVAGTGMIMSGLLSYVVCVCLRLVETKNSITFTFWVHKIMPVGFFMAMTLWTGNVVYMHLSVAFIQMLKVRIFSTGSCVFARSWTLSKILHL